MLAVEMEISGQIHGMFWRSRFWSLLMEYRREDEERKQQELKCKFLS